MKVIRILNAEPENYSPEVRGVFKSFAQVDERQMCDREELLNY
jgi:hypothetical protein